jgi:Ca2+/Na+ antiporter
MWNKKYIIIFFAGLMEQFLYTLYLISVNKYLINLSSILMFVYFFAYLLIVNYAMKDKNSLKLLFTYALSTAIGNWVAMTLKIIK